MEHRKTIAAVATTGAVGAALIIAETVRAIDAPWAAGLLIIGALLVLGAFMGWAVHSVKMRVAETNRPADQAFEDGLEIGTDIGWRRATEECRRKHMRVVRAIRH